LLGHTSMQQTPGNMRRGERRILGTVLLLALVPRLGDALAPLCHDGCHAPLVQLQQTGAANRPQMLRLRGGAWIDKRTPTYWPMMSEANDEIPEDGSVGGHYTMEEVCERGGGQWIGQYHPRTLCSSSCFL